MTPQQKAVDLFNDYYSHFKANLMYDNEAREDAKQCALMACDEIHEALKQTFHQVHKKTEMTPDLYLSESIAVHYYQEVKQEIKKL
jgi:hypothetical protein